MATRGQGYASTYLRGRREQLESAVAQATATIESDRAKYEAQQDLYRASIDGLDKQILEYDKLLAKAISDREKLSRPRTSRVTRGSQRESPAIQNYTGAASVAGDLFARETERINQRLKMPAAFAQTLESATDKMLNTKLNPAERQAIAAATANRVFGSTLFQQLEPAAQQDTYEEVNKQLQIGAPGFDLNKPDPATGKRAVILSDEAMAYFNPAAREKLRKELEEEAKLDKIKAAQEIALGAAITKGATLGGGTYSVTKDELAPGEAERMKRIQSTEFQAVAKALRDDGVLSDTERAALEKADIDPDKYLDDSLMQAVARSGLLMARRGELVGRQEQARADLAALVEPDTSEQRRRELTSMQYGPAGITPTDALLAPQKVKERMGEERERLSAKQALLQGVMRAASGDEFDLTEDENVYASQLAESVLGGNTAGVKQTYNQMREAGYDDDRIRSGFAVASRRAKELAARREAQAQAAAAQE